MVVHIPVFFFKRQEVMSLGWYKEGMYEEDLSKCIFYENKFFFLKYSVFVELGEWV